MGSGIMMGSSSSSSLCCTRSGSSHTRLWSISIMSRSNWNSLGMDGWEESRSALCRAWLLEDKGRRHRGDPPPQPSITNDREDSADAEGGCRRRGDPPSFYQ